ASHGPEHAQRAVPAAAAVAMAPARADDGSADDRAANRAPRPPRLLPCPEPIEAVAAVPDAPPVLFRWRGRLHRVARTDGPERIAPEWWRTPERWRTPEGRHTGDRAPAARDYYRVEDRDGGRYWLYRLGPYDGAGPARWFLHGLFA
ncbi:MAG: DUF6504 family protein, partial [Alphaproteobacteria bacterium]